MSIPLQKILIVQTAFIGDVILASALLESLHQTFPEAKIDFVLRKGNEGLFKEHPFLNTIYIWNKKESKLKNLFKLVQDIRKEEYTYIINLQRFFSSGFITALSRGKQKIGFDKNPLSWLFTTKIKHEIGNGGHEVWRNQKLIEAFSVQHPVNPKLYPSTQDFDKVLQYKTDDYICVAPASVWFTKQFPVAKWIEFINQVPEKYKVYILGSSSDQKLTMEIRNSVNRGGMESLCGKLSFLESAALMKNAVMNYVNDSAPLHIASAMNAPVAALFCSTVPEFGFGPLSDASHVIQLTEKLTCRPCGLHGKRKCPEGHFKCGYGIDINAMLSLLK